MIFRKLKKYRRIFYLLGIIITIVVLISVRKKHVNTICDRIIVTVLDSNSARFITQNTMIEYLTLKYEQNIVGNTFKNIKLSEIENIIENNHFVSEVEVFRKNDDILEIQIRQKKPLLRIFDNNQKSYYIDNNGDFIPTSPHFASYVLIFSGHIPGIDSLFSKKMPNITDTLWKNSIYNNCYLLAKELKKNSFTDELIDQVYITENNEFELIPKIGDFRIILGSFDNIEMKIENLKAFYKYGGSKIGWNKYSEINLEYTNQVICTKKIKNTL